MKSNWDVIVVGAGPAGAVAAYMLARQGRDVLLLDKATFPRHKVCGGCLSGAALKTLAAIGLGEVPKQLGGIKTDRFELTAGGQHITLPLDSGMSVSRAAFDQAVVQRAVAQGATFLDGTAAEFDSASGDLITIRAADQNLSARILLAADGLCGSLLRTCGNHAPRIARDAYMGVSAVVPAPPNDNSLGTIRMHCAAGGYVGVTHVEDGNLNIAAALSPELVRERGGPGAAVDAIFQASGAQTSFSISDDRWRGIGKLTRHRRKLGDHRLLILGDAAGYVEPFTGEGMAWAISSAIAVSEIADQAMDHWSDDTVHQWARTHRRIIAGRQRWCRLITTMLRRPTLTSWAIRLLRRKPAIAQPVLDHLARPAASHGSLT